MTTGPINHFQVPEMAAQDVFGRQTYLGDTYIVGLDATNSATTETPLLLLINPSTNKKSMFIFTKKMSALTSNHNAQFRIYYNPTITSNGTVQTPVNLRNGSSFLSTMNCYSAPTIANSGTFVAMLATTAFNPETSSVMQIIDPGKSMLLTGQVSNANDAINCEVVWFET